MAATVANDFVIDGSLDNYDEGGLLIQRATHLLTSDWNATELGDDQVPDIIRSVSHSQGNGTPVPNFVYTFANFDANAGQTIRIEGTGLDVADQTRLQLFLLPQDSADRYFNSSHVTAWNQSANTTLLAPLQDGDMQIEVADASSWSNSVDDNPTARSLAIFHDAQHPGSVVEGRYTFNVHRDARDGVWAPGGIVENTTTGGHTILLSKPWSGGLIPAGVTVRNADGRERFFEIEHDVVERIEQFPDQIGPRQPVSSQPIIAEIRDGDYGSQPLGAPIAPSTWPPGTQKIRIASNNPIGPVRVFDTTQRIGEHTFGGVTRAALSVSQQSLISDSSTAISETQDYYLTVRMRTDSPTGSDTHSAGYQALDSDGRAIELQHVARFEGATDTTLAQELSPGDVVIVLSDGSGWSQSNDPASRSIAWYGFAADDGSVYDDYTYTRNVASDEVNGLWSPSGVNGNVIILNAPWAGPTVSVGTAVRNATGGSETFYPTLMNNVVLDDEFQVFDSESIQGHWNAGTPHPRQFPPGTAAISAMARLNNSDFLSDDAVVFDSFHVLQTPPQRVEPNGDGQYEVIVELQDLPGLDSMPDDLFSLSQPTFGSVELINPTQARYTAPANFVGTDMFAVSLQSDWNQVSHVRLTLKGANHASEGGASGPFQPRSIEQSLGDQAIDSEQLVGNRSYQIGTGQTLVADGVQHPSLTDGETAVASAGPENLSFVLLEGPTTGSLDFGSDGTFTYTPYALADFDDSFRYAVFDGVRVEQGQVDIDVSHQSDLLPDRLQKLSQATLDYRNPDTFFLSYLPVSEGILGTPYRDENGVPYLSWRVHLLPQLGHEDLFNQFRLDEPWDSAHNLPLSVQMPAIFDSGVGTATNLTRIQRITSHYVEGVNYLKTGFDDNRLNRLTEIVDGRSQTVMLAHVGGDRSVVWTKPEDASFDESNPMATLGTAPEFHAVMFDGSVIRFDHSLSDDDFRGIVSREQNNFPPTDVGSIEEIDYVNYENRGDNGIQQISFALRDYHNSIRELPPNSYLLNDYRDEDGNPFFSWRVYLLPFLGHQQLFDEFELTEPWDSPHNLAIANRMPDVFRSIGDAKDTNTTRIVVPYGETALFQNDASGTIGRSRFSDIDDGLAQTLALIEVGDDRSVIWSKPDEVNFDPADPLAFLGNLTSSTFRATTLEGTFDNVLHLPANLPADALAAMISRDGGGNNPTNAFEYMPLDTLLRQYETQVESRTAQDVGRQLRDLGNGLFNFHNVYKRLPIHDDEDFFQGDPSEPIATRKPNLSWRVHLLPWIGYSGLYEQFRLDEPWDSTHNLSLLPMMPDIFRSVGDNPDSTTTRMQMFSQRDDPDVLGVCRAAGPIGCEVGPGRRLRDMLDGRSETLMLAETGPDVAVPWTEPADMYYQIPDPTVPWEFTKDGYSELGDVSDGFFGLMGDGSLRFLDGLTPEHLSRLITRASKDVPEVPDWEITPSRHVIVESEFITLNVATETAWPTDPVTLDVVLSDPTLIESSVASLTFGGETHLPVQSIQIRGIENGQLDGPRTVSVTVGSESIELVLIDKIDRPEPQSVSVESVQINDGLEQRSNIASLEVTFDNEVDLAELPNAFSVVDFESGSSVENVHVSASHANDKTIAQLTFSGSGTVARPGLGDFVLADGSFQLVIDADHVRLPGTEIYVDGDGNGIAGGDHAFGDEFDDALFALFGDSDGDGRIALPDFAEFRDSFGRSLGTAGFNDAFDGDGDGLISLLDFARFRGKFGSTRPLL